MPLTLNGHDISEVRDNQRLAVHYKDFTARRGGKEPPDAKRTVASR